MKLKIAYWVTTGLFGALMAMSGFMYLKGAPQVVEGFKHLGYPDYFRTLLGISKLLGVAALLVPVVPRTLREWAYAGFTINLISAAVSHGASGDPVSNVVSPLVVLAVLLTSHQLWHRLSRGAAEQQAVKPALG
jgi:hypothetical protein